MNFPTYNESRIDAAKCYASMFEVSLEYALDQIDKIVAELRRQCIAQGKPTATRRITNDDYSFKIDTTYLTHD